MVDLKMSLDQLSEDELIDILALAEDVVANVGMGPMTTASFDRRRDVQLELVKARSMVADIKEELSKRGQD